MHRLTLYIRECAWLFEHRSLVDPSKSPLDSSSATSPSDVRQCFCSLIERCLLLERLNVSFPGRVLYQLSTSTQSPATADRLERLVETCRPNSRCTARFSGHDPYRRAWYELRFRNIASGEMEGTSTVGDGEECSEN